MSCTACGTAQLAHDDGAGALVCTACGTLADPAAVVLADHGDHGTASVAQRTHRGRHLAQTKQDRDRRNTIAMGTFISTVLSRLNSPGLSPRAEAIFTQAMARGAYRWGRSAKLAAGASIALALREAHKSDLLHDIACYLDESAVALSRAFRAVAALLDFALAPSEPAAHLHILHAHLVAVMHSQLHRTLLARLSPLSLPAAVRTASDLSHILSHHSPPLAVASLPTPPTACALLVLGIEAEARAPLPHLGQLTRVLAARFALASGVVSSRYKLLYDLIEQWIRHVPWLDQFTSRSKVPKRAIVAKGLKDVIQFHQEIRQNQQKVNLHLELEPSDIEDEDGEDAPPSKRRKTITEEKQKHRATAPDDAIQAAYQFLLDPLSSSARAIDTATSNVDDISLLTHILTCAPDQLSRPRGAPLTRLQQLAASRGGSSAEHIADEELFAESELEGTFRDEREREALQPLFRLNWGEDETEDEDASASTAASTRRHTNAVAEPKRGANRVDMDALARILGGYGDSISVGDDEDASFPDLDDDTRAYLCASGDNVLRHDSRDQIEATSGAAYDWRKRRAYSDEEDDDDAIGAEERYEQEL